MSVSERTRPEAASGEPPLPPPPVGLGPLGWARWSWRQLTSMRTALLLLLLLAVGAVPGSLFPQRSIDPVLVAQYVEQHPDLSPWLERLGLFEVYASPWFSAIYLLLFVSLVGCVLPRSRVHLAALRQAPPRTPARLDRLPEHRTAEVAGDPAAVLAAARVVLRRRRYRTAEHPGSLAAQRGELRETGNLVFHLSLIGVLVAIAVGGFWGYRGQQLVPQGTAFVDSLARYDSFDPGSLVDADDLPPFRFVLRSVSVAFDEVSDGAQRGAPRDFSAVVDVVEQPGDDPVERSIRVNEPLRVAGASVYLAGNGYAPVLTVRDGAGDVVLSGQVPFLVQDANYTSRGVVKVADTGGGPQLGLQAILAPTAPAEVDPETGPASTFPDAGNPQIYFTAFAGDLGLDGGAPQNAYELDPTAMTQLQGADGTPFRAQLGVGQSVQLPDGLGSVSFDRLDRYAGFTVRHDPARGAALAFSLLSIAGLTLSLFVPRRRLWVRAAAAGERDGAGGPARTLVQVGALARSEDPGLGAEADAVLAALRAELGEDPPDPAIPHDPSAAPTRRTT